MAITSVRSPSSPYRRRRIASMAPGVAVDDTRADRVDGVLADHAARRREVDLGQPRAALGERFERDLDAGHQRAAEVLALARRRRRRWWRCRSRRTREAAEALADRDRVDEPVGADLARVVVADRHAGPGAGADGEHLVAEVALGHRRPLGLELGHGRGDDRGVELVEPVAAQLEQVAQRGAELVGGRLAHGGKAPVLEQLLAVEGPEVGLGVADVDREQHGRALCSRSRR